MMYFWIFCSIIYLISVIEIVGSRYLTKKKQDLLWASEFTIFPILFPPLAPIVAFDIYTDAKPCYDKIKKSHRIYQESLFCFLTHNMLSIDEWYEKNKKR